jgi:hypothetical protein
LNEDPHSRGIEPRQVFCDYSCKENLMAGRDAIVVIAITNAGDKTGIARCFYGSAGCPTAGRKYLVDSGKKL